MNHTVNNLERDIAAVFFTKEKVELAIEALQDAGVQKEQISLLCTEHTVRERLAASYEEFGDTEKDRASVHGSEERVSPSTVTATVGGLSLTASAIGGGALVASAGIFGGAVAVATVAAVTVSGLGAMAVAFMTPSDAEGLQHELDAGRIILLVRTGENRQRDEALRLLSDVSEIEAKVLREA